MTFNLFRRSPAPASTETAAYKELCKKVRKIDEKAADYMEELLAAHERGGGASDVNFSPHATLVGAFCWYATPQGHGYWMVIDAQLGDASSYPPEAAAEAKAAEEARKVQERAEAAARGWDSVKGQDVAKQALRSRRAAEGGAV